MTCTWSFVGIQDAENQALDHYYVHADVHVQYLRIKYGGQQSTYQLWKRGVNAKQRANCDQKCYSSGEKGVKANRIGRLSAQLPGHLWKKALVVQNQLNLGCLICFAQYLSCRSAPAVRLFFVTRRRAMFSKKGEAWYCHQIWLWTSPLLISPPLSSLKKLELAQRS